MLKLLDNGLFVASNAKDSHLAGIVLGTHNENDGAKFMRPLMTIEVVTNPAPTETIGIGGKTYTFIASGATGDQINVGTDAAATALNIIAKINADKRLTVCTAYSLGKATLIALVSENLTEPMFTADGAKIVEDLPWALTVTELIIEDEDYFKIPLTDVNAKPIVLATHHYDGDGVSGYSGNFPYQNFLY